MEDNLKKRGKKEEDLKQIKLEDDLIFLKTRMKTSKKNGRRPQKK